MYAAASCLAGLSWSTEASPVHTGIPKGSKMPVSLINAPPLAFWHAALVPLVVLWRCCLSATLPTGSAIGRRSSPVGLQRMAIGQATSYTERHCSCCCGHSLGSSRVLPDQGSLELQEAVQSRRGCLADLRVGRCHTAVCCAAEGLQGRWWELVRRLHSKWGKLRHLMNESWKLQTERPAVLQSWGLTSHTVICCNGSCAASQQNCARLSMEYAASAQG